MGFDVVFAPDADVTRGPPDPTIGARSAGSRPGLVARQVIAAGRGHQDAGVVPVLKHFPGHGSLTTDSHLGLPVQNRTRAELDRIDLRPFREAIAADAPAVMIGHIDVRAVDPGRPASVSRKVITGLLRRDLGFRGSWSPTRWRWTVSRSSTPAAGVRSPRSAPAPTSCSCPRTPRSPAPRSSPPSAPAASRAPASRPPPPGCWPC